MPPQPSLCPHVLPAQLGVHDATHCFDIVLHVRPAAHSVQTPPQPSESPHFLPVQLALHAGFLHVYVAVSHVRPLAGQAVHFPPQPSDAPHVLLVHDGVQPSAPPSPVGVTLPSGFTGSNDCGPPPLLVVALTPPSDWPSRSNATLS